MRRAGARGWMRRAGARVVDAAPCGARGVDAPRREAGVVEPVEVRPG